MRGVPGQNILPHGADVMRSDTANEIGHKLREWEDVSELAEAYNQARYGGKQ